MVRGTIHGIKILHLGDLLSPIPESHTKIVQ